MQIIPCAALPSPPEGQSERVRTDFDSLSEASSPLPCHAFKPLCMLSVGKFFYSTSRLMLTLGWPSNFPTLLHRLHLPWNSSRRSSKISSHAFALGRSGGHAPFSHNNRWHHQTKPPLSRLQIRQHFGHYETTRYAYRVAQQTPIVHFSN